MAGVRVDKRLMGAATIDDLPPSLVSGQAADPRPAPAVSGRRLRMIHYFPWASKLQPTAEFLAAVPAIEVRTRVKDPSDPALLRLARLDCEWHAENARVLASLRHPDLDFLEAMVVGTTGLQTLAARTPPAGEEWWLVLVAQHPQEFASVAAPLLAFLRRRGVRVLYYAYDEASRTMPCFRDLAPHLDILIHDEHPLDPAGAARLRPDCRTMHRSWVANVQDFAVPFVEEPENRLVFLGSQMGLTPHRRRQIDFLQQKLGDRFCAIHDHSIPVGERHLLAQRFKASLCPEGRKFSTPGMSGSHTDRPFWSGCLGLVPVAENSASGGRLDELARRELILRYPHGDLDALLAQCERALAATTPERRRIYDHFNAHETVGAVVASVL